MPHFLNFHPLRSVRPLNIGANKYGYTFWELTLNRYLVLLPCIWRYEGDISRAYNRRLCLSALLQDWGSVKTLNLCHILMLLICFT